MWRPSSCPSLSLYRKNSVSQKAHSLSKTSTNPIAFERWNQSKANKQTKETHSDPGRSLAPSLTLVVVG